MSNAPSFKEKANQNLISAKLLIDKHIYCSSVHCSFYYCLQNLLHVLFTKKKYDKAQFIADTKNNNTGTHLQASKLIGIEIAKVNMEDYKWYQKHFPELKKLREKADYSDEFIAQEEVHEALNKAQSIATLVNKI
ncbi:HEPN domain-containing protein [Chitinophaga skermanii]|uniref:HEPN domain-containing protein n=1 Tax=Chitinophaga skermanii TaxID=331697 RepID=A0A327QK54_9BACT|nr:HEPN domain-containing protein [Chitinophaga skermanii]RAJ04074.1 HEPN domain-containing protein [Chitinophaga skermanii]